MHRISRKGTSTTQIAFNGNGSELIAAHWLGRSAEAARTITESDTAGQVWPRVRLLCIVLKTCEIQLLTSGTNRLSRTLRKWSERPREPGDRMSDHGGAGDVDGVCKYL
jgi:hypothetical protein